MEDIRNIDSDTRQAIIDFDRVVTIAARVTMFSDTYLSNFRLLVERWLDEGSSAGEPEYIKKFMIAVNTLIQMEQLDRICDKVQGDIKNVK